MGKRHRHHEDDGAACSSSKECNMWPIIQSILLVVLIIQLAFINGNMSNHMEETGMDHMEDMMDDTPKVAPSQPSGNNAEMKAPIDDDAIKGDKNAPVTIVEFTDYECPFCGRFYRETYGQIVKKYIDTGKVNVVVKDFPLSFHTNAQKAAEAAECAGEQGKYYEMHDKLFGQGVTGGVATFKQYAADIGLNTADFNTCLDSGAMADEIKQDMVEGQQAGIRGTPGFIIDGELISGAQPFAVFDAAIQKALGN